MDSTSQQWREVCKNQSPKQIQCGTVALHCDTKAIDARTSQLENGSNAAKTSVRAPGVSADEGEHPFVWYFGAG